MASPEELEDIDEWHEALLRVRYAETDKMGVVYHANYLIWFEIGRTEFCRARGFSYLITGDTENPRWERINKLFGSALKSHVLAAPHHGSRNAAHPASLVSIDPHTVLIDRFNRPVPLVPYGDVIPEMIA